MRYPLEVRAALRWLADHELWTDAYPNGPDRPVHPGVLRPDHVRTARSALGLTAADLGYVPSPNAKAKCDAYDDQIVRRYLAGHKNLSRAGIKLAREIIRARKERR